MTPFFEAGARRPTPSVRSFAFYLPQFHPIAENDEWWGKGFTEWTNVTAAKPVYVGHAQPRLPRDLGFYDLRLSQSREAQAEIARAHGIDGFIYYHYWFSGRRVLEQPFEGMLQSGKPDMPFALCWANEDWRRNWDGRSGDVLLAQNYSEQDDREHMRYVTQAMRDERYIRIDGEPLFMVHRVALLPNPARTAEIWREEARNAGVGEIFLAYSESMERIAETPQQIGFDAAVEFAPDWQATPGTFYETLETHNYLDMASAMLAKPDPGYRRFAGVTPSFDNTPRKGMNGYILTDSHPDLYKGWVASTVMREIERGNNEVILFVNAWNEWAEGAILEPCSVWETSYLEAHAAGVAQGVAQPVAQEAPAVQEQEAPVPIVFMQEPQPQPQVPVEADRTGISVVMVTNGDPQAMMRCLQSAIETCTDMGKIEFVVVDNGSTDETRGVLTQLSREVKSMRNETPMPAHIAWMQGRDMATGEYVLFITNDVVLRPNWHTPTVMSLATDPTCVAVTPQMDANGLAVQSQPLTMTTGVCILSRAEMIPQSLPNEAKIIAESIVSVVAGTTVTP